MELLSTRRRRLVTAAATAAFIAVPLVTGLAANAATATGTVNTTGNPGPGAHRARPADRAVHRGREARRRRHE